MYQRERSKRWQASFSIDGHTIRVSTGTRDLSDAEDKARDTYLGYKFLLILYSESSGNRILTG